MQMVCRTIKTVLLTESSPQLSIGSRSTMDVSQAVLNGQKYLQDNRPVILGISPGNPHYYRLETLERLFDLARKTSEKVSEVRLIRFI